MQVNDKKVPLGHQAILSSLSSANHNIRLY